MEAVERKDITTLDQILDGKYGGRGAIKREIWEQEFETFHLGVLLRRSQVKVKPHDPGAVG